MVNANRWRRNLARALAPHDIEVDVRKGGHLRAVDPDGRCVFIASTPPDRRAAARIGSDLRRTFGIDVDVRACA